MTGHRPAGRAAVRACTVERLEERKLMAASSLSGYAYVDNDNDGRREAGERGIAGVRVNLSGVGADQQPVSRTAVTDANGFYSFNDLTAGTYTLFGETPRGHFDGKERVGTLGGKMTDDVYSAIVVRATAAGVNGKNYNFGELTPAELSGYVYEDKDNDGVRDAGETGIAGVDVTLTGKDDRMAVTRTVKTDATGRYVFTNLRPGTYAIRAAQAAGYLDGKETIGTLGGRSSVNDRFDGILLNGDKRAKAGNYNFGEFKASPVEPIAPCVTDARGFWKTKLGHELRKFLDELFARIEKHDDDDRCDDKGDKDDRKDKKDHDKKKEHKSHRGGRD